MNFFSTLELAVRRAKSHLCIAAVLFTGGLNPLPLQAQSLALSADASTLPVAAAPLLVAIEVKVLEAPPNHLPKELLEVSGKAISAAELDKLLRSVQKDESVKIASYPRMVTVTMHEVDIRSVVNVPLPNGQPALPIGSIFKILPAFREGLVDLTVDLTATDKIGEDKGFPIVSSRRHSTSVKVPDQTTAVFVLANTAPASATIVAQDMVCLVTPQRIDAQLPSETARLAVRPNPGISSPAAIKARSTILPNIKFNKATLTEAVDFLRAKSRSLSADGKGLDFLVKNAVAASKPVITLDLQEVSVLEALRQSAAQAGFIIGEDGDVIVLTPRKS